MNGTKILLLASLILASAVAGAESGDTASPGDTFMRIHDLWSVGDRLEHVGDAMAARAKYEEATRAIKQLKAAEPDWQPDMVSFQSLLLDEAMARVSDARFARDLGRPIRVPSAADSERMRIAGAALELMITHWKDIDTPSLRLPGDSMPMSLDELRVENSRLRARLASAQEQVTSLRAEKVNNTAEIAALKEQLTSLRGQIAKLQNENTAYETQVADLTLKLKKLNDGLKGQDPARIAMLMEDNKALRTIIMRHLRQQERLRTSKQLVLAEMTKMKDASQALMENLEDITAGKVWVTVDEEALFTEPELKMVMAFAGAAQNTLQTASVTSKSRSTSGSAATQKSKSVPEAPAPPPIATPPPAPAPSPATPPAPAPASAIVSAPAPAPVTPPPPLPVPAPVTPPAPTPVPAPVSKSPTPSVAEAKQAPEPPAPAPTQSASTPVVDSGSKPAMTGRDIEEKLMIEANVALGNKDMSRAEQKLKEVLRANPKNSAALLAMAGMRLDEGRMPEAEVQLQKVLVYEPDQPRAVYMLGVCAYREGKPNEAADLFKRATKLDKNNANAHHYLGILAVQRQDRARAEAEFKDALAIDPNNADAHFNLAVVYATSNPPGLEQARQHYREAIDRQVQRNVELEKLIYPTEFAPIPPKP